MRITPDGTSWWIAGMAGKIIQVRNATGIVVVAVLIVCTVVVTVEVAAEGVAPEVAVGHLNLCSRPNDRGRCRLRCLTLLSAIKRSTLFLGIAHFMCSLTWEKKNKNQIEQGS